MLLSSSRGVRVTVKADGCRGSGRETAPTANQPGGGGGARPQQVPAGGWGRPRCRVWARRRCWWEGPAPDFTGSETAPSGL